MRVLLIGPTALDAFGNPIKQRRIHLPGLTLYMLAAVTPSHVSLRLVNETVEDVPFHEHWDLVGLTGMGSGLARAWQIADEFREKGVPVVIGGIAASLCDPEWSLAHADSIVLGEAEEIWPQVIRDFEAGTLQRVYRSEQVPDIATLPQPRYDLMSRQHMGRWRPVQATRGCPFPCSFCSIATYFERRYRKRPVEQVVEDVRLAKSLGSAYITFLDDNIGVDWEYSRSLWEALIPEKITWMSQCSLHIADHPDLLRLARKSGCRLLSFGIESVSPESLRDVEKEWNEPARYRESVARIRKAGIDVSTEMILGLDGDDASVFRRTAEFVLKAQISIPRIHILTPVPGTPLYTDLVREGRITEPDLGKYSGGRVVFQPKHIDPDHLQREYWKLYERVFSWRGIFRRLRNNWASLGPYMRLFVVGVNLHYRGHIHHRITPGIV